MKIPVSSVGVNYDYCEINQTKNSIDFFVERFEGSLSDTKRIEQVLVRWLFTRSSAKDLLYNVLGLHDNSILKFEISNLFSDREFDILGFNRSTPHKAVAIECKRAKIKKESFYYNDVTGLQKLSGGVTQANKLLEVGFFKTYLLILTVVDGRERTKFNQLSRGSNNEQFNKIFDFPNRNELHNDVGLLFVEIVQTTDAPFSRTGFISVSIAEYPTEQTQKKKITENIKLMI